MNKKKKILLSFLGIAVPAAITTSVCLTTINNHNNVNNQSGSNDSSTSNPDDSAGSTTPPTNDSDNSNNGSSGDSSGDSSGGTTTTPSTPDNSTTPDTSTGDNNTSNDNNNSSDDNTSSGDDSTTEESSELPTNLNIDYSSDTSDLNNVSDLDFAYYEKIVSRQDRTPVTEVYETDLVKNYGAKGFKYPGYNYNYETGGRRYLTVDGTKIDVMTEVYNERVTNSSGTKVKYSDTSWIREQIAAGTLKKHPAADSWYSQKITDSTQSVTKQFKIGTTRNGTLPLGLYAAPGEIITLTFDDDTFELIKANSYKGISITINNNYWDNFAPGNTGQISNRYPFVKTSFGIDPTSKTMTFASPFGGNISLKINSALTSGDDSFNRKTEQVNFTISGAIESLHYVHGFTTEEDWNRQIQGIKDGTITAPNFSGLYSWAGLNIPFTGVKVVGGKKAETIAYPYETFKKWNQWQFLSTYMHRNDKFGTANILDIQFCDDIWNGGGAWGGNNVANVPVSWGGNAFLSGPSGFSILSSWGLMHEINHSFEQDTALFKKRGHGETNQVTTMALTFVSDTGRYRSPNNIYNEWSTGGSWTYLSNSYSTIKNIASSSGTSEYPIYGSIIFNLGGINYVNYVRYDSSYHPNTVASWTGLGEIQNLSNYFKLNFWPAFETIGTHWRDGWPTSYAAASESEKAILDDMTKYPGVDFLGNLYAAGNYLYDYETGEYNYAGDTQPAYEIPAGDDYTFDFGTYINSINKKFNWTKLEVSATSKNGVSLVKEGKKLVYKGSENFSTEEDEFDISIIPGTWEGKLDNYVPAYKFKIKVRPVVNKPTNYLYKNVTSITEDFLSINMINEMKKYDPSLLMVAYNNNSAMYTVGGTNQVARQKFTFVAPSTGTYKFNATWADKISAYVNGENVYKNNYKSKASTTFYEVELTKGETLEFDIYTYVASGRCSLAVSTTVDGTSVDIFSNSLAGGIDNVNTATNNQFTNSQYLTDQRFQYKVRTLDTRLLNQATNGNSVTNNFVSYKSSKDLYTFSSKDTSLIDRLFGPNQNLEMWGKNGNAPRLRFTTTFKTPSKVGAVRFGHRTNAHKQARATDILITGITEDDQEVTLYDGKYGVQFEDRNSSSTIINLNAVYTLKSIYVDVKNTSYSGLIFTYFIMSPEHYYKLGNNISVRNNYIAKSPDWQLLSNANNSYNVVSAYDGYSLASTKANDAIDFRLKNAFGFRLVGTTIANKPTKVDIYINGKIYQRDFVLSSETTLQNSALFKYVSDDTTTDDIRVTIVHKDSNPLIINFIQTYGLNTGTIPVKVS